MSNHKVIAVYGSQGSGKTTLSVQLALYLKKTFPDKEVMLIGLDSTKPILPTLYPKDSMPNISLGKVLSSEVLEQESLLENIQLSNDRIAVLGYNMHENSNSYASATEERYDDFFLQARHIVDFCVVDCTSDIRHNKGTAKAIANADLTIELLSAGVNGFIFDTSQSSLLLNQDYKYNDFFRFISVTDNFNYDIEALKNSHGRIAGVIDCNVEVNSLLQHGELLSKLSNKLIDDILPIIAKLAEV